MKFWLCFAGLLPVFFVIGIAVLVQVLFDGMRRDLERWRAAMTAGETDAGDQAKREGNDMILTGKTPVPEPGPGRCCAACGVPAGVQHVRGCVMLLRASETGTAPCDASGGSCTQDGDGMARLLIEQEERRRCMFEADLLLHCLSRDTFLTDAERRMLYEVTRAGRVELETIRRMAAETVAGSGPDPRLQAIATAAMAWSGWTWRKGGAA